MRIAPVALIASCSALVLLSACSTTKPATEKAAAPAPVAAVAPTPAQPSGADGNGANGNSLAGAQKATAPAFDPKSASIFFAFDDSTVSADAQSVLQQQSQWLQANPQSRLTVEGNCDERGGREYNLALGQRRADATRKALGILGAVDRVDTMSYGKERPRATCHDESCWKENRRVDFVPATK